MNSLKHEAHMKDVPRLMVVDSASVSRAVIVRGLRAEIARAEITACASATEALKVAVVECFDFIVSVQPHPDMECVEFIQQLRKLPRQRYTPLVVVSGSADAALRRAIFAVGVTDYFDKAQGYPALAPFIAGMMQHQFSLKGRVLYVEDSPTSARVICGLLQKYGLQVVHVPDAAQALELLRKSGPFDLVLTDYLLPGTLTGGDLVCAIRADLRCSAQTLPVLVITGESGERALAKVLEVDSNDFVTKPIVAGPFMARVRSLLLIRQQYQALRHLQEQGQQPQSAKLVM